MSRRLGLSLVVVVAVSVVAPAAAAPVKTKVVIEEVTTTSLPGDDIYRANGRVKASEDGCLNKRTVVIIERLGPPFDSNSLAQTVKTNKRGRWTAEWATFEGVSTGEHYAEVEKLERKNLKCSFARSKEYIVPAP